MPQIEGTNRYQLQMLSLDQLIAEDHLVRVIEAFIDYLPLEQMGFVIKGKSQEGRPAYRADILLKLYLYGYQNRIRSSRRLEMECTRNVELWWLLNQQVPCYKTIANFRKDNPKALKKTFRQFNVLCKDWSLFEGATIAVDGSKFKAQNSKKNNYNAKKIKRHLDYIDSKTAEYFQQLNQIDQQEQTKEDRQVIKDKWDLLNQRRKKYEHLEKVLEKISQDGELQISTSDPDARALPLHMGIVDVGYNVQSAVDAANKMIIDYEVTNKKDTYALSHIAGRSKDLLGVDQLDVLADKGYHNGFEIKACAHQHITTYVSPRDTSVKAKHRAYRKDQFTYNPAQDSFVCPEFQVLKSNGNWYKKNVGKNRKPYRVKVYKLPFHICNACPVKLLCAGKANLNNSKGRTIERSEYEDYIKANKDRVNRNKDYYRRRQAIVEHPFGTIKRNWGFDYTLLKTKEKVTAEFALIFLSYNLRRAMSVLGALEIIRRLKKLFFAFFLFSDYLVHHARLLSIPNSHTSGNNRRMV